MNLCPNRIQLFILFSQKQHTEIIKKYLVLLRGPIIMLGKGHKSKFYTKKSFIETAVECIAVDILDKYKLQLASVVRTHLEKLLETKNNYEEVENWDVNIYDIIDPVWNFNIK